MSRNSWASAPARGPTSVASSGRTPDRLRAEYWEKRHDGKTLRERMEEQRDRVLEATDVRISLEAEDKRSCSP